MTSHLLDCARIFIAGLLSFGFVVPALADLHKCTDQKNRTYYQDKPCQEMTAARLPNSLSSMAAKQEARAFFWQAKGDKGTFYLLGSLHFGGQSLFPLAEMVTDAFNRSDVLAVEADIANIGFKEMDDVLKGKGRYADNSKLEDHVKPFTWKKTVELANKLGLDEEVLHPLKPWLAALTLTGQSLSREGYTAELGIDKSLIRQAQGKKPIVELEELEAQINLFEQFSDQEQEQVLLQTLQELNRGPEYHKGIVDAWMKGDAEEMDLIVRQGFDSGQIGSKLFKVFISDINERMANRIADLVNDGRTYFFVVGAGHLGGEKGILKLLGQKGFKITQP